MMELLKGFWGLQKDMISWCHVEFRRSANNFMRDFQSLRALWNWIYLALYVFLCVWAALNYPKALPTAIVTTGTIVSAIFVAYVASKGYEKKMDHDMKIMKLKNGFHKGEATGSD